MSPTSATVPHLTTAMTGPLMALEQHFLTHQAEIESWFRQQWLETPAPVHSSVDIRNAGFKVAPVDTNLFPAGFNNLNPDLMPLSIQAAQNTISQMHPHCRRILLIPESHTRNVAYFESLHTWQAILINAGYDVRIGSLLPIDKPQEIALDQNKKLLLEPLQRIGNRLSLDNFSPCLILLNNDLLEAVPEVLLNIEQPIRPPIGLGWSARRKSVHFDYYQKACAQFSRLIDIDPWLLNPLFSTCDNVDFMQNQGIDCLVDECEKLLEKIREKYHEHGVEQDPFLVIKADSGTYGMGITMIKDPQELRELNRKQRTKMSATKGRTKIDNVIIQEGVYTFETLGDEQAVAEPVVYMIGHHVVGGFYRVHQNKGIDENLNAPGMHFEPLAFAAACNVSDKTSAPGNEQNRFYIYGVIARLALVAAAQERKQTL